MSKRSSASASKRKKGSSLLPSLGSPPHPHSLITPKPTKSTASIANLLLLTQENGPFLVSKSCKKGDEPALEGDGTKIIMSSPSFTPKPLKKIKMTLSQSSKPNGSQKNAPDTGTTSRSAHTIQPLRESISSCEMSHDPAVENLDCDDSEGHYSVEINTIFAHRYRIDKLLGQGTFGRVIQAYDMKREKMVAIKIIKSVQKYRDASKVEIQNLRKLAIHDPQNRKRCIQLQKCFDYRSHVCLVFELLAESLFDFMKRNSFRPFKYRHIQIFAGQLLEALRFMHSLEMVHTDLKPENLMLINNKCRILDSSDSPLPAAKAPSGNSKSKLAKGPSLELTEPDLMLIDFGSSVSKNDHHASVVSTRHYRAPEIILGIPWSCPCDLWSLGCILAEMTLGHALFQTHDNAEHLALMQAIIGPFSEDFLNLLSIEVYSEFFRRPVNVKSPAKQKHLENIHQNDNGRQGSRVHFPLSDTPTSSIQYVKKAKQIRDLLAPNDEMSSYFLDLLLQLLQYSPESRITAHDALRHPFFYC